MSGSPPSVRARPDVALGMIGIGLAVAAALLAVDGPMTAWAASCRNPVLDAVVRLINPIGSGVTLLIACMILFAGCRMLGGSWLRGPPRTGALAVRGARVGAVA